MPKKFPEKIEFVCPHCKHLEMYDPEKDEPGLRSLCSKCGLPRRPGKYG